MFKKLRIVALLLVGIKISHAQQFTVQPGSVVQAKGLTAVFECLYPGATVYDWALNGSFLSVLPPGVETDSPSADSPTARLIIPAILQYNNTVVQCEAVVREGGVLMGVPSENATLLILQVTQTTADYNLTISWGNPFTTNISFCVDARSVGSSEIVESVCVSDPQVTFTSLASDLCEEVSFTVIPTDGVRNGTASEPVTESFRGRRGIENVQCRQANDADGVECQLIFNTPLSCVCELMFTSIDNPELPLIVESLSISGNGSKRYILDPVILPNRNYSVDVTIHSPSGVYELLRQNLTTHDIIGANANPCSTEGALNTSCTFVQNTTARGYLAIVSELSCASDNRKNNTVFIVEYNTAGTQDLTNGIGSGVYQIAFFDLERNGLPTFFNNARMSGSAAKAHVNISNGTRDQQELATYGEADMNEAKTDYEINDNQVCVFCSSRVECLVLMYDCSSPDLIISQLVPVNQKICVNISASFQYISVVFFRINRNGSSMLLDRHPGKMKFINRAEFSGASSTSFTAAISSVLLLCVLCVLSM